MDQVWANRAASAEAAVAKRHLKRLWQLPGTQLGVVGWPATRKDLLFGTWHYWWQAHLLDNLSTRSCATPNPTARRRSSGRSDHIACATTDPGSTTTTTTWRGWRW